MGEMIDLKVDDTSAAGYLAVPTNGNGPGILLMHAWWGLNSFFRETADKLASEGYVVLAPDLYGGKIASEIEDAKSLIGKLDYHQAIKVEEAALDYLLNHSAVQGDKVAAIGFSMGTAYATWLSTFRSEVAAIVLFYGGGDLSDDFTAGTNAAFLGHFAEVDEWEPDEGVRQLESHLTAAGRDATFHFYPGVGHWFMEDNRPDAYNADAAQLAWERTINFLDQRLR